MSSTTSVAASELLTAEEFVQLPDTGYPEELVRGKVVRTAIPDLRHGQVCARTIILLGRFLAVRDYGHLLSNNAGVITRRNPDTMRGPHISYYSYSRFPKGPLPRTVGPEVPELVIEVRSPSGRWANVLVKVGEYLEAGVAAVVVLDEESETALLQLADAMPRRLGPDDELALPEILPGFAVAVKAFFE